VYFIGYEEEEGEQYENCAYFDINFKKHTRVRVV
jgi:hypothetical protein